MTVVPQSGSEPQATNNNAVRQELDLSALYRQSISTVVQPTLTADDFDGDEDDWFIEECAHDMGLDPREVLRDVRSTQKRRAKVRALAATEVPSAFTQPTASSQEATLAFPPGFAGALAQFIYQQAPRPVAEVAVVGALGLLAGVAGREWNISASGLNVYIVLVARSGIGKEAMHSGISKLVAAVTRAGFLAADQFVCFDDFVSGPALIKACLKEPCFVNVAGEIGHKFRTMADNRDSASRSLKKQMTVLYTKSGRDNVAGGLVYSNAESSVASVAGVAFSIIGESTPGTFFESLTGEMMEDGFMSRFNVVEYNGDRPDKNPMPVDAPPPALVTRLIDLMTRAQTLRHRQEVQQVVLSDVARALLEGFDMECDRQLRLAGDDESRRQMWNRAHLKALRVAALLAVGDDYLYPTVSYDHASWAIGLVRADIAVFSKRISSGDVGEVSDDGRERKLISIIRDYIQRPVISPSYRVPEKMHKEGLVPRSYLQMRLSTLPAFRNHKLGANRALEDTLRSMVNNGWLMECKGTAVVEGYGHHGKTYRVLDLPK